MRTGVFGVLLVNSEDERVRACRVVASWLFRVEVALASWHFIASWILSSLFFHLPSSRLLAVRAHLRCGFIFGDIKHIFNDNFYYGRI